MKYERELVTETKYNFMWFGSMGITSSVIDNSQEIGFVLGLLLIKIVIVKLMMKCLSKKIMRLSEIETNFIIVVLTEMIPMIPFITIISCEGIMATSFSRHDRIQKLGHLHFLLMAIVILPFWYIAKMPSNKKIRKRKKTKAITKDKDKTKGQEKD